MDLLRKVFGSGEESRNKMGLYVVYDRVAEQAGPVFQAVNDQVAFRSYVQLMHGQSHLNKDEFVLYKIASYDDKTMDVEQIVPKKRVFFVPLKDHKGVDQLNSEVLHEQG